MSSYITVELANVREGDEMYQGGQWTPVERVVLFGTGDELAKIFWANGGTHAAPAHHFGKARRAVEPAPKLIRSRRSCIGCGMRPGQLHSNGLCSSCQSPAPAPKMVGDCDRCNVAHEAEPSHEGRFGEGQIWAVCCPVDGLTQWHTGEGVRPGTVARAAR